MPQMGYDMQEGTVVRWLKSEGSAVSAGEPIAEIETDKAAVEFPSEATGVLLRILVLEGATVPVGEPIALIGEEGETVDVPPATKPAAEAVAASTTSATALPTSTPPTPEPPPAPASRVPASPMARRMAEERHLDISRITGTGPGGRITKDDVLAFAASQPVSPEAPPAPVPPAPARPEGMPAEVAAGGRAPLSRMRQQIARVTVRSKREKPHFYISTEVDMTRAMDARAEINQALEGEGVRISVNDLIIKACVEALKKYPKFNAFFQEDSVQFNERINIGVAIALEEGLVVPAIVDCANRSLKGIATASKDLAQRAEGGRLHPQEYTGGTFAISNLGMFDVASFVAIIHPPQSAVLAVGAVAKRPVVRDDQVTIAQMMTATLSADHRIVDGAEGARFLGEVKRLLEHPLSLLV